MLLGEVLTAARKSGDGIKDWLAHIEPEIWTAMGKAAEADGIDHATYARFAVADFSKSASEDDWATMMGQIGKAQDPGQACLLSMITWRLAKVDRTCGCSE